MSSTCTFDINKLFTWLICSSDLMTSPLNLIYTVLVKVWHVCVKTLQIQLHVLKLFLYINVFIYILWACNRNYQINLSKYQTANHINVIVTVRYMYYIHMNMHKCHKIYPDACVNLLHKYFSDFKWWYFRLQKWSFLREWECLNVSHQCATLIKWN